LLLEPTSHDITPSLITEDGYGRRSKPATVRQVPIDHLEIGDIVRVVTGGAPPTDGTIVGYESSAFDESMMTGESVPISKAIGDQVFAGTICKSGSVDFEVEHLGGGTM
jgi:P-type E1-E2 ATPase